jgi:serine/threonine protein kinase
METWFIQCEEVSANHSLSADHAHIVKFHQDQETETETGTASEREKNIKKVEDLSCEAFIHSLLTRRRQDRATVTAILDHPYLTHGCLPAFTSIFDNNVKLPTNTTVPPIYQVRRLYALSVSEIPSWPDELLQGASSGGGGSDGSGGETWARRQFSKLWAPMPKSYDVNNNNGEIEGGESERHKNQQAALLKTHSSEDGLNLILRGSLPIVSESMIEACSPFILITPPTESKKPGSVQK